MPHKKNSIVSETASNDAFGELEQLRLIVFGQAKQALDTKIESLEHSLTTQINEMTAYNASQFAQLHKSVDEQFSALKTAMADTNAVTEANKQAFEETNATLSSQLEMTENAGKDDTDIIHKRIDEEVNKLESTVATSMQEILAKFEQATKELTSSKTDRKTLAQLLANMANNLDADN